MAELMIPDNPVEVVQYPDAPYDLNDLEADQWRAIVRSMQPNHFTAGNFPILAQYCRHIVASNKIAQMTHACENAKEFNRREYFVLRQMQATESSQITKLGRALRLTQMSTTDRRGPKVRPVLEPNPWVRKHE